MKNGKPKEVRRYAAPTDAGLAREARALELLRERFADWEICASVLNPISLKELFSKGW